jgi:alanine racemase
MTEHGMTNWLEIDLRAIVNNYRELEHIAERPVMAVVKANAYGHGLETVAQALSEAGAAWLAVARFEEASKLRKAWIETDTLVLGYTDPQWAIPAAVDHIRLTVFDRETASAYSRLVSQRGMVLKVHVKIETGMNRIGVPADQAAAFIAWLHELPGIEVEGLFTHFACADDPQPQENDPTRRQIAVFERVLSAVEKAGLRPAWVHASNSAGILNYPQARYDLVRAGIALYGLHPSPQTQLPATFRPALAWKCQLSDVKHVPAGAGISYNHRYITQAEEFIGTIPVGYADGFRRRLGNKVMVRGKIVPVVGTICMDQCMLQLDQVPEAQPGDEVVLIGEQNGVRRTAEDLAAEWGTINYEVTCAAAARLPRFYINS